MMSGADAGGVDRAQQRSLIVAKIRPGAEPEVAQIFTESDATVLPHALGVRERSLYALGDLYVHLIEFEGDVDEVMATAPKHPGFVKISERLRPYISPYDPKTWRSPRDAVARLFYTWRADT